MTRKLLLAAAVVGLLLVIAGYVLLYTNPGLHGALRLAGAWLPGTLQFDSAGGRLAGPLQLENLRFQSGDLRLTAGRVRLDWRPLRLLTGSLQVTELAASDIELGLPPGAPQPTPAKRDLPPVATNLGVRLERGRIDRLRIVAPTGDPLEVALIELSAKLAAGVVTAQIAVRDERGEWSAAGRVETRRRYRHRLVLGLQADAAEAAIQARVEGDLAALAIHAEAPAWAAQIDASVTDPLGDLQWQARVGASLPGLERLTAAGGGSLREAALTVDIEAGGYAIHADPVGVEWTGSELRLRDSRARIPGIAQRIDLRGTLAVDAEPRFEVALDWIADTTQAPLKDYLDAARGTVTVAGSLDRARLDGGATLATRHGPVELDFDADGDRRGLEPLRIQASGGAGTLRLLGAVSWGAGLRWQLELDAGSLDPAIVWSDWPASLDLVGRSAGRAGDGAVEAALELDRVGGTFLGRPVAGTASARLSGAGLESLIADLTVGDNRITASAQWAGAPRSAEADLQIDDLGQLLPAAAGSLEARLSLADRAGGLALNVSGRGNELSWQQLRVATIDFAAESPAILESLQRAELSLTGVSYGGAAVDALELAAIGPWAELGLSARMAIGDLGEVALGATVDVARGGRSGRIQRLGWNSDQYGAWSLREPAGYRLEGEELLLDTLCLNHQPGLICAGVEAGSEGQAWHVRVEGLPADLAQLPLSIALDRPVRLGGEVSASMEALIAGDALVRLAGELEGRDLAVSMDFGRGWQALSLGVIRGSVNGDAAGLKAAATAESEIFSAALEASLNGPLGAADAGLEASLRADVPKLAALAEYFSLPVSLGGRGLADLSVSGSLAEPAASGRLAVSEVVFEAAEYGSRWRNGRLEAVLDTDQRVRLSGAIDADQGSIEVSGQANYVTGEARLSLRGHEVRVAQTPTLLLELSPDLDFTANASGYDLRGTLEVVNAKIEQFDVGPSAVAPSPDVVVVDEPQPESEPEALPLTTDLRVRFKNPAALSGYGMNAQLSGELRVVEAPGEAVLATGELRVGGSYQAYGQDLTIEEGRLIYAQTLLDNPSIRANAYREVGDVRAGVRISGRAAEPQLALYSSPAMSDNEILSYLILGRASAAGGDFDGSAMVTNAALQLGLKQGNSVVGQVGSKLGFDELSIAVDEEFGGAAVSIGRYLSPRLYLSYSTGLVQAIDLLRFEYRLGRKWSIQSEIGLQTRTMLSYELERGGKGGGKGGED